jgi:hypothetical protein
VSLFGLGKSLFCLQELIDAFRMIFQLLHDSIDGFHTVNPIVVPVAGCR